MAFFKRLLCRLKGHYYYPTYQEGSIGFRRFVRYHCERCGRPTKVMSNRQHQRFIEKECPSWGGPGTDSQGYKD